MQMKIQSKADGRRILSRLLFFVREGAKAISQAGQREADAERYLVNYGNAILRLAYSYVHNMADAEDILQDTILQMLMKAPKFENSSHEKAYLFRCAANISKNKVNYNKIREADELDETLISEKKEDLAFVWEAVRKLPEKYREVIHLFYEEGFKTAEIARILNRNESTVRSDLRRGREQLKKILKKDYDFE